MISGGIDIDRSETLLARHLSAAMRRFGHAVLGLVDLPAIESARPSRAELGVAAVLLWARNVDDAGLLDTVDAIATGVSNGSLPIPIQGPVVRQLVEWHRRHEQFSRDERRAIYDRIFADLDQQLSQLVALLCVIGEAPRDQSIRHLQVRVAVVGRELAGELSARATGIAAFAARDIVRQVRDALAILGDAELAQALGGGPAWTIVARHAVTLLGRRVDVPRSVARATAGRDLVEWLARSADQLAAGTAAPGPDDPVVHAALAYRAEGV